MKKELIQIVDLAHNDFILVDKDGHTVEGEFDSREQAANWAKENGHELTESLFKPEGPKDWDFDHYGEHSSFVNKAEDGEDYDFRIEWSAHIPNYKRLQLAEKIIAALNA